MEGSARICHSARIRERAGIGVRVQEVAVDLFCLRIQGVGNHVESSLFGVVDGVPIWRITISQLAPQQVEHRFDASLAERRQSQRYGRPMHTSSAPMASPLKTNRKSYAVPLSLVG